MSVKVPRVVIPFRPRSQVTPRITNFRSTPPEHAFCAGAAVRIESGVKVLQLIRGLRSAGLAFRHDTRTGEFVILPMQAARS